MKKSILKKILYELDYIEIQGVSLQEAATYLHDKLQKEYPLKMEDILHTLTYLRDYSILKETGKGIDVCPCATIFSRSEHHSQLEQLSYFESMLQHEDNISLWQSILYNQKENPIQAPLHIFHTFDKLLLKQLYMTQNHSDMIIFPNEYILMKQILDEYTSESILLSKTLCALYTKTLIIFDYNNKEYKNMDKEINKYDNVSFILDIIPEKGIPIDRNESRNIQSFYKDTLFHEYNHVCAICKLDFPQLLIASHIKPFRDCAHVFEAIDHNNGLLLCKNHDILFDQGYLSFNTEGRILISDELNKKLKLNNAYLLHRDIKLLSHLLTKERKKFLQYHNHYIYKGNHS